MEINCGYSSKALKFFERQYGWISPSDVVEVASGDEVLKTTVQKKILKNQCIFIFLCLENTETGKQRFKWTDLEIDDMISTTLAELN